MSDLIRLSLTTLNAPVLFEIHSVIGEHHDLRLIAAIALDLFEDLVERFERDCETCRPLCVQQTVSRFEECKVVAILRR